MYFVMGIEEIIMELVFLERGSLHRLTGRMCIVGKRADAKRQCGLSNDNARLLEARVLESRLSWRQQLLQNVELERIFTTNNSSCSGKVNKLSMP